MLAVAITTVNILSEVHDDPALPFWEPALWEYSSALALLPSLVVPWFTQRLAPPGPPWLRFALVHAVGALAFSAAHVALFVLLRHAGYGLRGEGYIFDPGSEFLYEYRKDLLGYAGAVFGFWFAPRLLEWRTAPAAPAASPEPPSAPALFEVRDGARLLRVPPADIVAVTSAGNYVEVRLADGRTPLTRMTLAQAEAALGRHGFVRVHRSWLVNAARVRALTPEGSGDYALELDGGLTAPLSRRFPEALDRLRRGPAG